jgi:hypothetical protein
MLAPLLLVAMAAGCTGNGSPDTTTPAPSGPSGPDMPSTVSVGHITFDVSCTPVAEALVDIELPHAGEPKIRAVTGLWDHQAVAVLANDPKRCGVWALGLARGLSSEATAQIQQEVADGVKNFGVTASPVPREP